MYNYIQKKYKALLLQMSAALHLSPFSREIWKLVFSENASLLVVKTPFLYSLTVEWMYVCRGGGVNMITDVLCSVNMCTFLCKQSTLLWTLRYRFFFFFLSLSLSNLSFWLWQQNNIITKSVIRAMIVAFVLWPGSWKRFTQTQTQIVSFGCSEWEKVVT